MSLADHSEDLLEVVVAAREGGHRREGQVAMTRAVADAFEDRRHLVVQAGTGTGKSFAYLVPALAHGARVVVSTATKSLQDQLGERDLPFLMETLADELDVSVAVVKGRGSYLCLNRLEEHLEEAGWSRQEGLFGTETLPDELRQVVEWAAETESGDRDAMPFEVDDWSEFSVAGMECPGREQCPQGAECFAMKALEAASEADVVVVNHHLYGAHLASEKSVLPEHDIVVFDEAHRVEDTFASALGVELAGWRVWQLVRAARSLPLVVGASKASRVVRSLTGAATELEAALGKERPGRFRDPAELETAGALERLLKVTDDLVATVRAAQPATPAGQGAKARLLRLGGHMLGDLDYVAALEDGVVGWIEGGRSASLKVAPVDVASLMRIHLLDEVTVVATSATLSVGGELAPASRALGLRADDHEQLMVESPFDYRAQACLYAAASLPDPRSEAWADAAVDEASDLLELSGGRGLVLTTSYRMLDRFAERLAGSDVRLLVQGELPKQALVAAFEEDETSVLVATMGFWEGLDVPGRSLELVVIDKLPFPRPDDPLWTARREVAEQAGLSPFGVVDLPRAAVLLAQGAGRLIRSVEDRGLVAVLDPRLATKSYGSALVRALPDMARTADPEVAREFVRRMRGH